MKKLALIISFILLICIQFVGCAVAYKTDITPKGKFSEGIKVRYMPQLVWPEGARKDGIEGWVILVFDIETDGSTSNIRVKDSYPLAYFNEAAISAASKIQFYPIIEDEKPVKRENHAIKLTFAFE